MKIDGLRSPYEKTGGVVYFGRMIDKIRLHAAGKLPKEYVPFLSGGFDRRMASFFRAGYEVIKDRVLQGGTDEEIFQWCCKELYSPTPFDIEMYNSFMIKRGWRDDASDALEEMKKSLKLKDRIEIQTYFDMIVADESSV